jgi:hypothetical protein
MNGGTMVRLRRRPALYGLTMAALLLMFAWPAAAQSPTTSSLAGQVSDVNGGALGEVLVTLTNVATGVARTAFTSRGGTYRFVFLDPGEYELVIEKIGYAPKRVVALPMRPGGELQAQTTLSPRSDSGLEVQTELYDGGALAGARAGAQWLGAAAMEALSPDRGLVGAARLTTLADESLAISGLAPHLARLMIDGVPFRPVAEADAADARFLMTGFPLASVGGAQLVTTPLDVEWTGAAGGFLGIYTQPGTASTQTQAAAFWGGSALPTPTGIERGTASYNDLHGSVVVRGPLLSDSARFSVGVEARRQERLLGSAWPNTAGAAALAAAGPQAGLDLEAYRRAGVGRADVLSAFGRLDWAVSERQRVDASMQLASMPAFTTLNRTGLLREYEGGDLVAGVGFRSVTEGGAGNDLRLSFTSSRRRAGGSADIAPTFIAAEGIAFGARAAAFDGQETSLRLSNAVHLPRGAHRLKLGAELAFGSFRYEQRAGEDGEYYFGSADDLLAGRGVFFRREGPSAAASWSSPLIAAFAQNLWSSDAGVDLLLGVRVENERLPTDNVRPDAEWLRLTGDANTEATGSEWRISPRASLTWDLQRRHEWVLHAAGGMYHDRLDPLALAEWQTEDGTGVIRRAAGALAWPPVPAQAAITSRTLTLLGPDFDAPRTFRIDAGLVRRVGSSTAAGVTGSVRRTENLVRRSDRNLMALPAFRTTEGPAGRPVYGTLVQQGSVIAATPGSGRRFDTYDEVAALTADGWSEYWGVTLNADHAMSDRLALVARYTFSQTTDNWFGARDGGLAVARPQGLDAAAEWAEGTSDFDVPHRAIIAAVFNTPSGVRLSGLYRLQSGTPFTPGFRPGVDVSGDGYAGNDPAFVDAMAVSGLAGRWSCLQQSAGRFADRNSCRAPAVHGVDVTAGFSLFRVGGAVTEIMLEAFDVFESETVVPDAALYLIESSGSITTGADRRTVTLPLVVNPSFGEPLARRHPGRRIRIGFSLTW